MTDPLQPVIARFVLRMGAAGFKRAWAWANEKDWATRLSRELSKEIDGRVSRRRIERWLYLPQTKKALSQPSEEAIAEARATLREKIVPGWRVLDHRTPAEWDMLADQLLLAAMKRFLQALDLNEELEVLYGRQSAEIQGLREILTAQIPELQPLGFPPPAAKWIQKGFDVDREKTLRIVAAFESGSVEAALNDLLSPIAPWLLESTPYLLIALAVTASAHELSELARRAFLAAADSGAPDPKRWLGHAALTFQGEEESPELEPILERIGNEPPKIVGAMTAFLREDFEHVFNIDLSSLEEKDDIVLMRLVRSIGRQRAGDNERAIEELEQGLREAPTPGQLALALSFLLLNRAVAEDSLGTSTDKRRAFDLALAVRDQKRQWKGPSSVAAQIAAKAMVSLHEFETALRLLVEPPAGEATALEAEDADSLKLAAQAAIGSQNPEVLAALRPRLQGFEAKWVDAHAAREAGDVDTAVSLFLEAWDLAEEPNERFGVQQGLADLGASDIPGFDELLAEDPVQAALVSALSASRREDIAEVGRQLRPHINSSSSAAQLLGKLQAENGDPDSGGMTLKRAYKRFNRPEFLVQAARMFYAAGSFQESESCARDADALLPTGSDNKIETKELLIQLAGRRNDVVAIAQHAQELLQLDATNVRTQWTLVQAIAHQFRLEEAWQAYRRYGSPEPNDEDLRLWLALQTKFSDDPALPRKVLNLLPSYEADEEFRGVLLLTLLMIQERLSIDEKLAAEVQAETDKYLHDFPDNKIIQKLSFENVEELIEKLEPMLSRGAKSRREIVEKVAQGESPYGLLSTVVGKPYAEALLRRGAGCIPSFVPVAEVVAYEQRSLKTVLDSQVVVEPSALALLSAIPDVWPKVQGLFKSMAISSASLADILHAKDQLDMRSTLSVGWDPVQNQSVVAQQSEQEAEMLAERAAWVYAAGQELELLNFVKMERFKDLDEDRLAPWLSPVDLALESGWALYSDDPALRALSRHEGGGSFGTVTALLHLRDSGLLTDQQYGELRLRLMNSYVVDLMPSLAELEALASSEQWSVRSACFQMSRRLYWMSRSNGEAIWARLLRQVKENNRDALSGWMLSSIIGRTRATGGHPASIAAGSITAAIRAIDADELDFALMIDGSRRGVLELGSPDDPLPETIRLLLEPDSETTLGERASRVVNLSSALESDDRERVVRQVLGIS